MLATQGRVCCRGACGGESRGWRQRQRIPLSYLFIKGRHFLRTNLTRLYPFGLVESSRIYARKKNPCFDSCMMFASFESMRSSSLMHCQLPTACKEMKHILEGGTSSLICVRFSPVNVLLTLAQGINTENTYMNIILWRGLKHRVI